MGPLYKSVVFSGGAAYISFDYAEGLSTGMGNRFVHSKWQVMMDYFIRHRLLLKTVK